MIDIRWLPRSENYILAAHADGALVVYDKDKEDAVLLADEIVRPNIWQQGRDELSPTLEIRKSVSSPNQRTNPVAFWKLLNQRINGFAFSPDERLLAVVSEDGSLRILDYFKEELVTITTAIVTLLKFLFGNLLVCGMLTQ